MEKNLQVRYEGVSSIIKAMAHPTRLMIIEELSQGERCVCELTDKACADISTVSKHLSVLKNAGIVGDDKRGQMVFYRLTMECTLNFISCLRNVIKENAMARLTLADQI